MAQFSQEIQISQGVKSPGNSSSPYACSHKPDHPTPATPEYKLTSS